jgi:hypothetical protein
MPILALIGMGCNSTHSLPPEPIDASIPDVAITPTPTSITNCLNHNILYTASFTEVVGDCNILLPHPFVIGDQLLEGTVCSPSQITIQGCQVSETDCYLNGSGYQCSVSSTLTISSDAGIGEGILEIVCHPENCDLNDGVCAIFTDGLVNNSSGSCQGTYDVWLIKEKSQ